MPGFTHAEFAPDTTLGKGRSWLQQFHVDLPLLLALMLLAGVGLIALYSASEQNTDLVLRQLMRLSIAFALMIAVAQLRPDTIQHWSPWLYALGMVMLIAVLILGVIGKGAQRWLNFGLFTFQPSELMKLALPMIIAWYFAEHTMPPRPLRILAAIVMLLVPTLLVAKQPDLGTALVLAASGFFVLFLAGLRWRVIIITCILLVPLAWVVWQYGMHDYQRNRVLTFLNPEIDPLGAGYHIIQSTIAIGSGGMYGKGWLNGTQSHLDFLPERKTDFIFPVFSEEFGFIGSLLLLAIYAAIIIRGLMITLQAQDTYTRLLAGSITLTFFIYVFINIGMVSGLLPVVGIPLPLVSYGGTSMVTLLTGFGILMSIQTHRKLIST
ncbi:MAG: rod shape-determining protein RodA [Gammaproteobacteria bacterium]|nr:rod shape-determining protein RodA [Gammaproteobacteria bacterium]